MNLRQMVIIAGGIGVLAIILVLILISYQELDVENTSDKDIQSIINESEYKPLPKAWQISGPFQIDRSEYAIGEKIFIVSTGLETNDKGEIVILRLLNATAWKKWSANTFDGAVKPEFRTYAEPQIDKYRGICSIDDITGTWLIVFNGTNYPALEFNVNKKIVPGTNIEPVC